MHDDRRKPSTRLAQQFAGLTASEFRGAHAWSCRGLDASDACEIAEDEHGFDLLVDVTCVDYLNYRDATDRFGLRLLADRHDDQRTIACGAS